MNMVWKQESHDMIYDDISATKQRTIDQQINVKEHG